MQASQKGQIGITVVTFWYVAKSETAASKRAASKSLDFIFGWFAHPVTFGEYPKTMRYATALKDSTRIRYHYQHLQYLSKAIKEGVKVKGYFAWALLDVYEWDSGYTVRFGLTYIDYKNKMKRYLKYSAYWFKMFLLK
ncbi:unnamed protein product [Malus baccata var. baccata]